MTVGYPNERINQILYVRALKPILGDSQFRNNNHGSILSVKHSLLEARLADVQQQLARPTSVVGGRFLLPYCLLAFDDFW